MKLDPVESSHIAAIGYLDAERVLLVRYKDGSLYAWPQIEPDGYAAFAAAPSKGKWIAALQSLPAVQITKGGRHVDAPLKAGAVGTRESDTPKQSTESGFGCGAAATTSAPLNIIDEDAGKCCRRSMAEFNSSNLADITLTNGWKFICPTCSEEFAWEMVGPNRYWRIVPQVHIVRPR